MLKIRQSATFKKDFKRCLKQGLDPAKFEAAVALLIAQKPLPDKYREHFLSGDYRSFRECHIAPDWLLIYRIEADALILTLARTGSHADLF